MLNKDKKNFFYILRNFCEMTLQEAGDLVPTDKTNVWFYEHEGVMLLPLRYVIALKKESGLSWETVGELLETWNQERPLVRNKSKKMFKPKVESVEAK